MDKSHNPTDAELEILQILWSNNDLKVAEIHKEMQKIRNVGYTTVLKTLQIMFSKELVTRRQVGKGHAYSNNVKREDIQSGYLSKLVSKVYNGSVSTLVMNAIGNGTTSKEELDQIKAFIQQQEKKEGL